MNAPDELDLEKLLRALEALSSGDFRVRLDPFENERLSRIADALNGVVSRNQALTEELERVAEVVIKNGQLSAELSLQEAVGGWARAVEAVNTLIRGLSPPIVEIERIVRKVEEIKRLNNELERRVIERTRALEAANSDLQAEISERRRAEEEVRRLNSDLEARVRGRTSELESANRDLEAFSYSVSHDLRAPLRRIHAFVALLLERSLSKLDSEEQDYLRRISSSSLRMEQLIGDMLELSSATHGEIDRSDVDLSGMAQQILDELNSSDPGRGVAVQVQPNIHATGDAGLLRMVLENLLDNAWKFSSRSPDPTIEFGTTGEGDDVYLVRDNGVGFDPSQADVLFDPFRRLRGDYEGAGIGLSTVKRIIARHGGRIWAEGEAGRGATFYFTLGQV